MKDIFVASSKDDKNLSKKLVSKLEAEGYACYVLPRDNSAGTYDELISDSRICVLILSEASQKSEEIKTQLKTALENDLVIIPFKSGKIKDTLGMQFLLHELEWTDAYEDGFDEAFEILKEILEEVTEGKKTKPVKKVKPVSENENFELKKTHLYWIIGVLVVALIYFAFFNHSDGLQNNQSTDQVNTQSEKIVNEVVGKDLKPEEQKIVGSWKMTEYEDSRTMSPEERRQTEQSVEQMKARVLLTFNADRSFSRVGFTPQVQKGYWEYDAVKKKIYLVPENGDHKESINIINLTDKEMTFVVTEQVESSPGNKEIVTTKLTFQKQ